MGFVAQIDGDKSHTLVDYALTMLKRMNHRGGTGAEPDTGDGAGVLMTLPDKFFRNRAAEANVTLPVEGDYAVGMFFLPNDSVKKADLQTSLLTEISNRGYNILWTRDVPFNFEQCGPGAQKVMPSIVQVFVERPAEIAAGRPFEDSLFKLRRKLEKTYSADECFVCTLSAKTIVYKGMLHAYQVGLFYSDLTEPDMEASICLVHSRFSTNTFPSWDRAQPFRFLAHNGEINTLRGAENWMQSNQIEMYNEDNSDSAKLENCMENLYRNGREIPQALMMMIPEAWGQESQLDEDAKAFYEYATSFVAPWDGPAGLVFTDGDFVGAALDRNGLRPSRFSRTKDNFIVVSSESGVVDFEPSEVVEKGVLGPGNFIIVDTTKGTFTKNAAVKQKYTTQYPYKQWLKDALVSIDELPTATNKVQTLTAKDRKQMWKAFGYTDEIIRSLILPMAELGEEPIISMGFDAPLAILSDKPQSLFTYFKQQFAQVTNPPIDAIREKLVIGTEAYLGRDGDYRIEGPENCCKIKLNSPILTTADFEKIVRLDVENHQTAVVSTQYALEPDVPHRLQLALESFFKTVEGLVDAGHDIIILSDREEVPTPAKMPFPILLAVSGLHDYMVQKGKGNAFSVVVDSAEIAEVNHYATILSFGASAIHPYGAYETLREFDLPSTATQTYRKACEKGVIKVMSKMGISTIAGYNGAQLFEAVGLADELVDQYFHGTTSRIGGLTLQQLEQEYLTRHEAAFGPRANDLLASGGSFQFKAEGEHHLYDPTTIYQFQLAIRAGDYAAYKQYADKLNHDALETPSSLRHMWEFKNERQPVDLSEVEPVSAIVKRFKVGAMSFGSLSAEAHECIAAGMNAIGAKSNSGEGGEHQDRFHVKPDGTNLNSKIKQVSSGRFGVNAAYLMSAEEIQIKMAQGAKPGEGGQLPGKKVFPWVAEVRGSTPGVRLISPPPHHDIYSIEDLAQLIYDLKAINPYAKINVKLASSTGVGTIATGCVKAGADIVVISGYDGGTGASPKNSVRDAGLPWEMGLAEAHQTLSMNNLRQRMTLETDGKLMTGRDIAIAALLGAEEYSFASLALVAVGCVMMRVCSLNTCPVGVATQDPKLRAHFAGKPEHVANAMRFLANDLREIMAANGFRTIDEMIGHVEVLKPRFIAKGKAKSLDFSRILSTTFPIERKVVDPFIAQRQWPELDAMAKAAIDANNPLHITASINNVDRTVGARMGGWIAERYGNAGVATGLMNYTYTGIAGQSFASFATKGMTLKLIGEANDYVAKSLSGARLIVVPPTDAGYDVANSPIVGNVACFGANAGEVYLQGRAGERFCVRNSGATVVVEGVGDHGCEYMTGGVAVILGTTGRNFGAGMSGGVAYVYDVNGDFADKCNLEMVDLYPIGATTGDEVLRELIENHVEYTDSVIARQLLADWPQAVTKFVKVYPTDLHAMNDIAADLSAAGVANAQLEQLSFEVATTDLTIEAAIATAKGGK
jgi:glutamate synthase (NADPH/NADH) large chain